MTLENLKMHFENPSGFIAIKAFIIFNSIINSERSHRAETVVVKLMQFLTTARCVEPVMSSQTAGAVPPAMFTIWVWVCSISIVNRQLCEIESAFTLT